jgi:hypothetical protein
MMMGLRCVVRMYSMYSRISLNSGLYRHYESESLRYLVVVRMNTTYSFADIPEKKLDLLFLHHRRLLLLLLEVNLVVPLVVPVPRIK